MVCLRRVVVSAVLAAAVTANAEGSPRASAPLPAPASVLAHALALPVVDRSRVMLDAIRIMHSGPAGADDETAAARAAVAQAIRSAPPGPRETVPLPLGGTLWRDVILENAALEDNAVIEAILGSRTAALLYYGLQALDDETLAWFGADREALLHVRKHPGSFAAFGRSVRIRNRRVVVPGGTGAEAAWQSLAGASPGQPSGFIRALFRDDRGRLAFFYDSLAHVGPGQLQLALGAPADGDSLHRFRALADAFGDYAPDWDIEPRPFLRGQLDPSIVLSVVAVDADGTLRGPGSAALNEAFRGDERIDVPFKAGELPRNSKPDSAVEIAWLVRRVTGVMFPVGRRRLDAFLFAQRVSGDTPLQSHVAASLVKAFIAMPALMLSMERSGVRDAALLVNAAGRAQELQDVDDARTRRLAIAAYQCALAFIERGVRSHAITGRDSRRLAASLLELKADRAMTYEQRVAGWLSTTLVQAAPAPPPDAGEPLETAVLALLAGTRSDRPRPVVEWEGRRYRVDPAAAEMARLRKVRRRQETVSLDEAIQQLTGPSRDRLLRARRAFVDVLTSIVYAVHLGDPDGPALAAGNAAVKHELESVASRTGVRSMLAWHLPTEHFGGPRGWRVQGSLLGLDTALRRLALRRMDHTILPAGRKLPLVERHGAMLTVALLNPHDLADADRDAIASAMQRGRDRLAVTGPAQLDAFAADARLGEWRRESLRWVLVHEPAAAAAQLSLLDLLNAGSAGAPPGRPSDVWGAATLPFTGCLCVALPRRPWEDSAGRPAAGLLAAHGVDVTLLVAAKLAEVKLPAQLAPAIVAFAMQDVIDAVAPAHFDDWQAFSREALAIQDDRLMDYIAALAADGPLVPAHDGGSLY